MGHARAIINIEDPETQYMVFEQIMKYDFSVRKVEEIVRELMKPEEEKEILLTTKFISYPPYPIIQQFAPDHYPI